MRIKPEQFAHLEAGIKPLDTPERRQRYLEGKFMHADRVQDLNKRYRWDLLYAAKLSTYVYQTCYPYCNDDHIDTALRKIVSDLK